jgi:hypothetical protein
MRAKASTPAWAKAIGAAALVAGCASSPELNAPICNAVLSAAATQAPGTSSTMSYYTIDELDGEPVFLAAACNARNDARMEEFCGAVIGHTSREFMNAFAYDVTDCVRAHGRIRHFAVGDAHTSGLRRDRGRSLQSMDGQIGATRLSLRERDAGFELTFQRQANQ